MRDQPTAVTRTEWSADPVINMGNDGCQSTEVIAAVCSRLFCVVDEPHCSPKNSHDSDLRETHLHGQIEEEERQPH